MLLLFTAVVAILLTIFRLIPRRGKWAVSTAVLCALFCLGGIWCVVGALRDAAVLKDSALPDADTAAWAYDMMRGWFSLAAPFSAAIGIPLLLAALIRHKMVWMRTLSAPCAVVLIQLAAAAYAAICENDAIHFIPTIQRFAAGCGALMLCGTAADAIRYAVSGQPALVWKAAGKSSVESSRRGKKRR